MKTEQELKELFDSGSLLNRDYSGHEQMLMNEGAFIAIVSELLSANKSEVDIPSMEQLEVLALKIFPAQEEDKEHRKHCLVYGKLMIQEYASQFKSVNPKCNHERRTEITHAEKCSACGEIFGTSY